MLPLSLDTPELELLIGVIGVLTFIASFAALLFSAVLLLGFAQLLYVGGRWSVTKIHQSYSLRGTRTVTAVGRIVPDH